MSLQNIFYKSLCAKYAQIVDVILDKIIIIDIK